MASLAWHHELAQAAPVAAMGTLSWQVSKMAFDAAKVFSVFSIKNLVMALWHPARYGQLRAPLVEQRVPYSNVDEECAPPPAGQDGCVAALGAVAP